MRSNRMSRSLFAMMLSMLVFGIGARAQAQTSGPAPSPTPKTSATPSLEHEFLKNVLRDQKAIWTSPFHLQRHDVRWLAPMALGTAALMTTDRITGDKIAEFHGQLKASRIVSYAGSTYGISAIAASFYLAGRATHNDRARETGILSTEALIDSLIVVNALKGISQRARPLSGRERSEFFEGGTSFPSGHSIHAWAVATVIANEYHDRALVKIGAYGIASAVSIARFTGQRHYLSDVLVGSALGYGIGRYVYHAHHRKTLTSSDDEEKSRGAFKRWPLIAPEYDRRSRDYGATLTWSF